ncbi:MAG: phospho-N-acetylmuramoyl-pentapeptide-transferase [Catonella sp.]|uniref:phospho-N-acetylmuramoyl-pentapeptide- transferase n=1 Tax=Catonella sp. TaxID=2382125 RepID=UPI003FA09F63
MFSLKIFLPAFISFILTVILCPIFIPILHKMKFGQFVREEGPESHLKKVGTPTMGGIVMLAVFTLVGVACAANKTELFPIILLTVGFGFIGFLDDYIKLAMKRSLGLRAWQKLGLQIIVTAVFTYLILKNYPELTKIIVPFTGGSVAWELGILFVPFVFVTVLGTVNGANFTDGLDGLATTVTLIIAMFFAALSIKVGSNVSDTAMIMIGTLLGFLIFNTYPAKVFMGDTGSLALGGFVAAEAFMLKIPLFIIIIAFIYLAEILSVMIQVSYFKLTHGKRIFKMSPIHHHFELSGFEETRVVAMFAVVTIIMCFIGFIAL